MTENGIVPRHRNRRRKDHYVPQGYLRGFIDPARAVLDKPLWHYDLESKIWAEKSPSEVGWERGFYDYFEATTDLEHPDVTFAKYEREFSLVRDHMLERNFKGWVKQHKPFLLGYMNMMRARSPLFIEQQTAQNRLLRGATVTSVDHATNSVTVDSLELRPLPEGLVRNGVISQMRQEIEKGSDWMGNFNWCLRYTKSPADPFITGKHALLLEGPAPTLDEAMKHPDTLIWFPICWQACLVGSLRRFDEGTFKAHRWVLDHERELFRRSTTGYVISPTRLDPL
jgi:hypothetical protein